MSVQEPARAIKRLRRFSKSEPSGSSRIPPVAVREMAVSLPGSRNSKGSLAAWEPPWRKSFARLLIDGISTHRYTDQEKSRCWAIESPPLAYPKENLIPRAA